jgi:hypothetical protein
MLEIKTLLPKVKFLGPIRRRRFRSYFTKYLLKNHIEGLEQGGLLFKASVGDNGDFGAEEMLEARNKESNKLIYRNGRFCRWSRPIRKVIRRFIYAQGWAYYKELRTEIRAISTRLT